MHHRLRFVPLCSALFRVSDLFRSASDPLPLCSARYFMRAMVGKRNVIPIDQDPSSSVGHRTTRVFEPSGPSGLRRLSNSKFSKASLELFASFSTAAVTGCFSSFQNLVSLGCRIVFVLLFTFFSPFLVSQPSWWCLLKRKNWRFTHPTFASLRSKIRGDMKTYGDISTMYAHVPDCWKERAEMDKTCRP